MEASARTSSWRCPADALSPGQTMCFELERNGAVVAGFVVNHEGRYHAYKNRCPHAGTPLDWRPNEFFTADGRSLLCGTHGAVFDPDTGVCTEGPCPGARLEPLLIERDGEYLVVTCRT